MRTHIVIDDHLLEQALELGRFPSKTAAVNAALTAFVRSLQRREVLAMRGKVQWIGDLKQMRKDRHRR